MVVIFSFIFLSALGTYVRWVIGKRGPIGILMVNVIGSFLLACTSNWVDAQITAIGIGGLGAFTTFSAFASDSVSLQESQGLIIASSYVAGTAVLSISAAGLGLSIS